MLELKFVATPMIQRRQSFSSKIRNRRTVLQQANFCMSECETTIAHGIFKALSQVDVQHLSGR